MVQWLMLRTSTEEAVGSIPGRGIKIPHETQSSQKKKQHKNPIKINKCYEQKEGQAQPSVSKLCVHVFTVCVCIYVCVYVLYIKNI